MGSIAGREAQSLPSGEEVPGCALPCTLSHNSHRNLQDWLPLFILTADVGSEAQRSFPHKVM